MSGEESTYRSIGHSTKLWLSVYKPKIVFAAQVNDSGIAVGEDEIAYDNLVTGSYANVRPGMTMYVGSTPNASDQGRLRVRYASSTGTVRVAENSEVNWQNDLYITIRDFYEIWSVFPNYALNGTTVTFYKDNDIVYAGQNADAGLGTIVTMNPHHAGFVGSNVYWTAEHSKSVADRLPLSYSWIFEGATITGSTSVTPGNVTYNTPGHFTTRLTITTNDGIQDTSYRHVSIYDREGGANPPIKSWELINLKGSREEGGYSSTIRMFENISDIVDGALIVIFAEDMYGSVTGSVGGNAPNRSDIVFVGYVINGSIRYDYQHSYVEFDVGSSSEIMKQQPGLSISLDSVVTPATWYELADMDVLKTIYHYFKWHSTLLNTNDLIFTGTNYKFQYFDSEASTLYDAMQSFMQGSLLGTVINDRQNTLYIEDGAETRDYTALALDYTLLRQDWRDEPEIIEVPMDEVSYLELSGVAWNGANTGTWAEFVSASPGYSMGYFGTLEQQTGLVLTSQSQLNTLTGRVFAYRNARYPDITVQIAGNYRSFDITPLKKYGMTIFSGDTVRGINFVNKPLHIEEMNWEFDAKRQLLSPEVRLHEFTDSYPGVTIIRPQTPIVNPPQQPPISLPPFPIIPFPTPSPFPPAVVPAPPPSIPGCWEAGMDAPPNGPYYLSYSGELRSDEDGVTIPFECLIRNLGIPFNTYICFNGTWEYSIDGGTTWVTWPYHTGIEIRYVRPGGAIEGAGVGNGIDMNWASYNGFSPEQRCASFPPSLTIENAHIAGLNIVLRPPGVLGEYVPYPVYYTGVDVGFLEGTCDFTWNPYTWRGTAHWYGSAGFPVIRREMFMQTPSLTGTNANFTIMIGSRPDNYPGNDNTGLPRLDYNNLTAARRVEATDSGGTIQANPEFEGNTGTASGDWLYWLGDCDPNILNTGNLYIGHHFGEEGRSAGGSFDRTWEFAILAINGETPRQTIFKFAGTIAMYNIC